MKRSARYCFLDTGVGNAYLYCKMMLHINKTMGENSLELVTRNNIAEILDKLMYLCLILFSLTFYIDIPINFITTAFVLGIIKAVITKDKIEFNSKHVWFVLFFVLMILISIIFNNGGGSFKNEILAYRSMYIGPLTGLFLVCFFNFTKERAIKLLSCLSVVLLVNACVAIVQAACGISIENGRVIGFFNDKMLLAAIHVLILPIILSVLVFAKNLPKPIKMLYLITVIVNVPAVILSNTRIVWIGLFISYSLILLLGIKNKVKVIAGIACIIAVMAVFIQMDSRVHGRFDSITNISTSSTAGYESNRERILMWQAACQMFKDHPLFGVGLDNFHDQYQDKYKIPSALETPWHAHDVLLNTIAQSGMVGTIGLIALFAYLYYNVIQTWRRYHNVSSIAYFFSLLTFNINFFTDVLFCGHYIKTPTYIFWLITGIYLSINKYIVIQTNKKFLSKSLNCEKVKN